MPPSAARPPHSRQEARYARGCRCVCGARVRRARAPGVRLRAPEPGRLRGLRLRVCCCPPCPRRAGRKAVVCAAKLNAAKLASGAAAAGAALVASPAFALVRVPRVVSPSGRLPGVRAGAAVAVSRDMAAARRAPPRGSLAARRAAAGRARVASSRRVQPRCALGYRELSAVCFPERAGARDRGAADAATSQTRGQALTQLPGALPQVDDRLNGDGAGIALGVNDPVLGAHLLGVFTAIWALYYIANNSDSFLQARALLAPRRARAPSAARAAQHAAKLRALAYQHSAGLRWLTHGRPPASRAGGRQGRRLRAVPVERRQRLARGSTRAAPGRRAVDLALLCEHTRHKEARSRPSRFSPAGEYLPAGSGSPGRLEYRALTVQAGCGGVTAPTSASLVCLTRVARGKDYCMRFAYAAYARICWRCSLQVA